jgi:hypothetical protein
MTCVPCLIASLHCDFEKGVAPLSHSTVNSPGHDVAVVSMMHVSLVELLPQPPPEDESLEQPRTNNTTSDRNQGRRRKVVIRTPYPRGCRRPSTRCAPGDLGRAVLPGSPRSRLLAARRGGGRALASATDRRSSASALGGAADRAHLASLAHDPSTAHGRKVRRNRARARGAPTLEHAGFAPGLAAHAIEPPGAYARDP